MRDLDISPRNKTNVPISQRVQQSLAFPIPNIPPASLPLTLFSLASLLYHPPSFFFPHPSSLPSVLALSSIFLPLISFHPCSQSCSASPKCGSLGINVCWWQWWIGDTASVVSDHYNGWLEHLWRKVSAHYTALICPHVLVYHSRNAWLCNGRWHVLYNAVLPSGNTFRKLNWAKS